MFKKILFFLFIFFSLNAIADEKFKKWDEKKWVKFKEKRIKEIKESPVFVERGGDGENLGFKIMQRLNCPFNENSKVLIKPNIGGFSKSVFKNPEMVREKITDPSFIKGIIKFLREKGVKSIVIAEGKNVAQKEDVKNMLDVSGYSELLKEMKIPFIDLNYYGDENEKKPIRVTYKKAGIYKKEILLPSLYLDYMENGIIINVAKLKVHHFSVVSLSIKNLMGVFLMEGERKYLHQNKGLFHKEFDEQQRKKNSKNELKKLIHAEKIFGKRLADLLFYTLPHISIIEGVWAVGGDGVVKTEKIETNICFAGKNPLSVDLVAAKFLGFINNDEIKKSGGFSFPYHIYSALKMFYPDENIDSFIKKIKINGEIPESPKIPYRLFLK